MDELKNSEMSILDPKKLNLMRYVVSLWNYSLGAYFNSYSDFRNWQI